MFPNIIEKIASIRNTDDLVTEGRQLDKFDRVRMNDYGELIISQGPQPGLTVTAHKTLIDRIESNVTAGQLVLGYGSWWDKLGEAFTTSLTRKPIRYQLVVEDIIGLEICGMALVTAENLKSDKLNITIRGVANTRLKSLEATKLVVNMVPGGKLTAEGKVHDQEITIKGPGTYEARNLVSQRANIGINGPGQAVILVNEYLNVTISGIGRVSYYGRPVVTKQVTGMATIQRLSDRL